MKIIYSSKFAREYKRLSLKIKKTAKKRDYLLQRPIYLPSPNKERILVKRYELGRILSFKVSAFIN